MCVCALLELSLFIWLRLWSINKTNHHSKCLIEPLVIFSEHCCFVWNGTNKRIIYNSQYSRQPAQLFTPALHSCEALVRMVSRIVYFRSRIFIHTTLLKRKIVWKRKKNASIFFCSSSWGLAHFLGLRRKQLMPLSDRSIMHSLRFDLFWLIFVLLSDGLEKFRCGCGSETSQYDHEFVKCFHVYIFIDLVNLGCFDCRWIYLK